MNGKSTANNAFSESLGRRLKARIKRLWESASGSE